MTRRKSGNLRGDDEHLWRRITEDIAPLKKQTATPDLDQKRDPPAKAARQITRPADRPRGNTTNKAPAVAPAQIVVERPASVSPNMDKRNFTRLLKGQKDIDATLDLHGMTLSRAFPALQQFIQHSVEKNRRMVLVITGKGKKTQKDEFQRETAGVLRRQVPVWLTQTSFFGMILQITSAHPRHGGSGAYYVVLRRRRN